MSSQGSWQLLAEGALCEEKMRFLHPQKTSCASTHKCASNRMTFDLRSLAKFKTCATSKAHPVGFLQLLLLRKLLIVSTLKIPKSESLSDIGNLPRGSYRFHADLYAGLLTHPQRSLQRGRAGVIAEDR